MKDSDQNVLKKIFFDTERLVIRRIELSDMAAVTSLFSDPEVMKLMSLAPPENGETAEALVNKFNKLVDRQGYGMWAVEQKKDGEFIGHAALKPLDNTEELEAGVMLAKPYWRFGYATELLVGIFEFGFKKLNLDRIVVVTHPDNLTSVAISEKCGMKNEGKKRYYNRDGYYLSITSNQYKNWLTK